MNNLHDVAEIAKEPSGSGAAAILSAGIGCFSLAILAVAGDKWIVVKNALVWYKPTGALSGVSTAALLIWLLLWGILEWRWRNKSVAAGRIHAIALTLLGLSLLLTFPPIAELF
jgi:hypothetical protein